MAFAVRQGQRQRQPARTVIYCRRLRPRTYDVLPACFPSSVSGPSRSLCLKSAQPVTLNCFSISVLARLVKPAHRKWLKSSSTTASQVCPLPSFWPRYFRKIARASSMRPRNISASGPDGIEPQFSGRCQYGLLGRSHGVVEIARKSEETVTSPPILSATDRRSLCHVAFLLSCESRCWTIARRL